MKIDICHVPPGNPGNAHTITIDTHALDAHMAHNDYEGACVIPACPEFWNSEHLDVYLSMRGPDARAEILARLDADGDGIPCESLPPSPVPTTTATGPSVETATTTTTAPVETTQPIAEVQTPKPLAELPRTGFDPMFLAGLAILLIVVGIALWASKR